VTPDPRWLEILKASGWQTTFLAIGFAAFLALAHRGVISTDALPLIIPATWLGLFACASLAIASIGQAAVKTVPVHTWVRQWHGKRQAQKAVAAYIPFMSPKDRQIIGYLLQHRQKTFSCASDGGYAAALIARGIIRMAARPGQMVDLEDVPHLIPDYIWEVLEQHRDQFPHRPEMDGRVEVEPWREGWMAR
jgi:hypothetical protein